MPTSTTTTTTKKPDVVTVPDDYTDYPDYTDEPDVKVPTKAVVTTTTKKPIAVTVPDITEEVVTTTTGEECHFVSTKCVILAQYILILFALSMVYLHYSSLFWAAAPKGVDDLCFHTYREFSPPSSPSPPSLPSPTQILASMSKSQP